MKTISPAAEQHVYRTALLRFDADGLLSIAPDALIAAAGAGVMPRTFR